jgi:hypothetical protein
VPFTVAHAAAAWPFRRTRLILSAVVVGTFAPDFEYFLRMAPGGQFGHTLLGALVLDLPLSLLVLWLFHAYMREPMVALLPEPVQRRIPREPSTFPFWGPARLAWGFVSILIGIATHLLWDSFTHPAFWPYRHWTLLSQRVRLPLIGTAPYYKLFQHGSTIAGLAILLIWLVRWYRATLPKHRVAAKPSSPARNWRLLTLLTFLTSAVALMRAFAGAGTPNSPRVVEIFAGYAVITFITLTWLQWLIYGIVWTQQQKSRQQD